MQHTRVLSPEDLKKKLDTNIVEFLFDLRDEDEFKAWRIEGKSEIPTLNIPQVEFVGEEEGHLAKFPKNKQIVVVCAHGDSSKYSAELLQERGLDAVSLMGGMDSWSEFYETRRVAGELEVYQMYRVARGCMSYLIASAGVAVAIDAPRHLERITALAASLNVKIVHVLDTHLHADHISGGEELAAKTGAAYHLHPADAQEATIQFTPLSGGEKIVFGNYSLEAVHSPGHTPGSTSFLLNGKYLFTGDTIMRASIGRPDLGGKAEEWAALLYDTLFRRFQRMADDIVVLSSHSSSIREQDADGVVRTTMGRARAESDLYQLKDLTAFTDYIKKSLPENPERYQDIRKVNLGLLKPEEAKRKELEIGKNLCGMAKQ